MPHPLPVPTSHCLLWSKPLMHPMCPSELHLLPTFCSASGPVSSTDPGICSMQCYCQQVRLAEWLRRKDTTLHARCSQLHHHKQPKPLHSVQNTVWERRPHLSNTNFWSCGAKPKPAYCDYCETVLPQRYFKSDCMESSYLLQMHIVVSATPPKRVLPTCSNTLRYQWTSGLLH